LNCIQDCKNWKLYVEKAKTFRGGGGEVEGEEEGGGGEEATNLTTDDRLRSNSF
jgi:hypothetical protein